MSGPPSLLSTAVRRTAPPPAAARPFLKWAGGKRQLLHELGRFVPPEFGGYHEPFLGSGAFFFDLWSRGALQGKRTRVCDLNADLVGTYRAVARDVEEVVRELQQLAALHAKGGSAAYYRIRDGVFNPARRGRQGGEAASPYPAALAAMFIYLNRTGYNGLFRLNTRGDFNVPPGRYAAPVICNAALLRDVARVLRTPGLEIACADFTTVADAARPGDFVYFDPPYAPLSQTARFTAYTAGSFQDRHHEALQRVVLALAARGCAVLISNSDAPIVRALYGSDEARAAGLRVHPIQARRAINSRAAGRGPITELVITNVAPAPSGASPRRTPRGASGRR